MATEYKCFYHSQTPAVGICDNCMHYVCSNDYRVYEKKIYGLINLKGAMFNYCVVCNAYSLKSDMKNGLFIYLSAVFFLTIIFFTTLFSYPKEFMLLISAFVSIIVLLFIPYYGIRRNYQIAEKELIFSQNTRKKEINDI